MKKAPLLRLNQKGVSDTAQNSAELLEILAALRYKSGLGDIDVTPAKALKVPTVLSCVQVISQSLSMLPFVIYRKDAEGKRNKETANHVYKVIAQKPNSWQSPVEFARLIGWNLCVHGNYYAFKVKLGNRLLELRPIQPNTVRVKQDENYELDYEVTAKTASGIDQTRHYGTDEIFHIRGPITPNGYSGISAIEAGSDTIAGALIAEKFAAEFFSEGAKSRGAFVLPQDAELSDTAFNRLKEQLQAASQSQASLLLEGGLTFLNMDYNAQQSQLLELRSFLIYDLCRLFRMPPHMVQALDKATFSNIEHQAKEFVDMTLMPWIRLIESSIKTQLMDPEQENVYPKISVSALLRGDNASRADFLYKAIGGPWMTVNEGRAYEDMDKRPEGDTIAAPQYGIAAQAAAQDELPTEPPDESGE